MHSLSCLVTGLQCRNTLAPQCLQTFSMLLFILSNPGCTEGHVNFRAYAAECICMFFFFSCVCVYVWVYMCVHCLTTVCVSCGCGLVVFGACESIFLDEIQTACSSTLSSVILRFCSLHTLPCPFVKYSSALVKWHTSIIHSAPLVSSYPCSYSAVKPEGSSALGSSTPL